MRALFSMNDLVPGPRARAFRVEAAGSMRRRLLDLGLVEHTDVECLGRSPGGDPAAYLIRGAVIALRDRDSRGILVYTV